jgi:serine/threonine protein kinase
MTDASLAPGSDDDVLVRFLRDLEQAAPADRSTLLEKYCVNHPEMETTLRGLAKTYEAMDESRPPPAGPPQPQRLGEFKIVRQIARGGMGEIYEAVHERLLRRVAVKTIRRDRPSDEARQRFQREQLVLARLHQTHVIPIYTAGEENAWQYFVMPYIDGLTLQRAIRAARENAAARPQVRTPALEQIVGLAVRGEIGTPGEGEGTATGAGRQPVPSAAYFRSAARVMAEAAEAMQHVHDLGFVHRDLKPSNLMLDQDGHCWVIDFGLAGYLRAPKGIGAGQASDLGPEPQAGLEGDATAAALLTGSRALGTVRYMAPEQFRGKADARSDVWGLGITLCELLALRPVGRDRPDAVPASAGSNPGFWVELPAGVPRDLTAICGKAVRPDPAQRYPTALAFAEDLRRWLRNEPTTARPARVLRRFGLWCRRKPGWAAALAALVLLLGLGAYAQHVRLEHAEKDAAAAARERDQLATDALHQEILRLSLGARSSGWSRQVEDRLRRLAEIRRDGRVRDEWASSLLGLDVHLFRLFRDGGVSAVAFDAAGGRLVVGGRDAEAAFPVLPPRLWDGKADVLRPLSGRPGGGPVGFRPDGTPVQLLLDPRAPGCLVLWDMARGRAVREFKVEPPDGQAAAPEELLPAMTPTASFVAAACRWPDQAGTLTAWETATGRVVRQWRTEATALALAPDGTLLAAGDEGGQMTVWPLAGREPGRRFHSERDAVQCLAIGRDNRWRDGESGWLLAAGYSGSVTVWDLHAGVPRVCCRGSHYRVSALALSPDATLLASGAHGEVRLWDTANGRLLLAVRSPNEVLGLDFSPDSRRLALGGQHANPEDGSSIWELEPGRGTRTLHGLSGQVAKVCYSCDGKLLAALAHNWEVGIWDLESGLLRGVLEVPRGFTADNAGLAFSPDGRLFAFASGSRARVWEAASGREVRTVDLPPGLVDALAFDPSGKKLLLFRVETRTGKPPLSNFPRDEHPRVGRFRDLLAAEPARWLAECTLYKGSIFSAEPACGGTAVAVLGFEEAGGDKARLAVYDSGTGVRRWSVQREPCPRTTRLQVDPAGEVVALAIPLGEDERRRLLGGPSPVGGHYKGLISVGEDEKGRLLDLATGRDLGSLPLVGSLSPRAEYVSARVSGLAFSLFRRDGREPLVTLGADLITTSIHSRFSRDGRFLAWGNGDGTVTVCDLPEVRRRLAEVGLGWEP